MNDKKTKNDNSVVENNSDDNKINKSCIFDKTPYVLDRKLNSFYKISYNSHQ